MESNHPPLFKHGAPVLFRGLVFSLLAIALMVADARFHALPKLRQSIAFMLGPVEASMLAPGQWMEDIGENFTTVAALNQRIAQLEKQQLVALGTIAQLRVYEAENVHLRQLLATHQRLPLPSLVADILYDARDPFTRRIIIDQGSDSRLMVGQPAIDETGVLGQVTRVFSKTAVVTLLTDKDQSIPVTNSRNGLRSVAFGLGGSGVLELRFMAPNMDVQVGDVLVTSGLDGVYPPRLPVAKVIQVQTAEAGTFTHVLCQPLAGIDRNRQVLVLLADTTLASHPYVEALGEGASTLPKAGQTAATRSVKPTPKPPEVDKKTGSNPSYKVPPSAPIVP